MGEQLPAWKCSACVVSAALRRCGFPKTNVAAIRAMTEQERFLVWKWCSGHTNPQLERLGGPLDIDLPELVRRATDLVDPPTIII
jgi:hypothetical protein